MELVKGQKYAFSIKETKIENGDLYYVINVNGFVCPLMVFPFQRGAARPPKLQCVFKGYNGANEPLFMQDIEPLLKQLYKIGESYEFKVSIGTGGRRRSSSNRLSVADRWKSRRGLNSGYTHPWR